MRFVWPNHSTMSLYCTIKPKIRGGLDSLTYQLHLMHVRSYVPLDVLDTAGYLWLTPEATVLDRAPDFCTIQMWSCVFVVSTCWGRPLSFAGIGALRTTGSEYTQMWITNSDESRLDFPFVELWSILKALARFAVIHSTLWEVVSTNQKPWSELFVVPCVING